MSRVPAIALCLLAALAAPQAAQAQHGERVPIGPSGGAFDPQPHVGFSAAGAGVAVYEGGGVRVATRPPGGAWTATLLGSGGNSALAVAANGAAVVAWRESATSVRVAYRPDAGAALDPNAAQFTTAGAGQVAAGIDSAGNAVVAFKDGKIKVSRSTGASFAAPEEAPLGDSPSFVSGESGQLDAGPRAFRDDTGNVVLVYRDAAGAVIGHRAANGTWSTATLPGAATAVRADADPATRVLAIATRGGGQTRGFRGFTSTGAVTPTLDVASSGAFDVAVREGGAEDLIVYSAASGMYSAGCAGNYQPAQIVPAGSYSTVAAAVTAGQVDVAWWGQSSGGIGYRRAARAPGAAWTAEPLFTTNGGGVGAAADYSGNALAVYVSTESGGATFGFPYAGTNGAQARCQGAQETPTPTSTPTAGASPTPTPPTSVLVCGPSAGTLLQGCNLPQNLPQICGPSGTILPVCAFPVQWPVVCGPSFGTILQACGPSSTYIVACGGIGTILPACTLPPPQMPLVCGGSNSILPACTGANNLVVVCGPSGTVLPQCNFNFTITPVVVQPGPGSTTITGTVTCGAELGGDDRSAAAQIAQEPQSCVAQMSVDELRLLRGNSLLGEIDTINTFSRTDRVDAGTDSAQARTDDDAFRKRARKLVFKFFKNRGDPNKQFNRALELSRLSERAGPPPYVSADLTSIRQRADTIVGSVATALRTVRNVGQLRRAAPRATAAQAVLKGLRRPLKSKRARIPAGETRRIKLKLKSRRLRALVRGLPKRQRTLRVILTIRGTVPAVRFLDVPLRVRRGG